MDEASTGQARSGQQRLVVVTEHERYIERVLSAVEGIPPGRVASYGEIAAQVGSGGPRQVGRVMALYGGAVCWWRVVRSDGRPAQCHQREALGRLRAEGAPLLGERVDMANARQSTDP